jgi:adenylate cyclase
MAGKPLIPPLAGHDRLAAAPGPTRAGVADLLDGLCRRLVGCGVALDRASYGTATLHPLFGGRNFTWRADATSTEVGVYSRDDMLTNAYRSSPFFYLSTHALEFTRWRLDRPVDVPALPLLEQLREQGFADYCAAFHPYDDADNQRFTRGVPGRMLYRNGTGVSFATRRAGGFQDAEVMLFRALAPALALAAKSAETHTLASFVLDTYLGAGTGRRVLDGEIRRGDGERIQAAI